jgi:cytochrome c oxidase subunit IV
MAQDAQAHEHAAGLTEEEAHHIVPLSVYYRVFAALMVLLVITLFAAYFDLAYIWGPLNIVIAMTIAVVKAVLIVLYFMHVRYSSKITWFFAGASVIWLIILFTFALCDYFSRGWMPGPWQLTIPMQG